MGSEVASRSDMMVEKMDWERKWGVWDQFRFMMMIVLWVAAWVARTLLVFLPQQHSSGILGLIDHASSKSQFLLSSGDDQEPDDIPLNRLGWSSQGAGGLAKSAIGRALSQVLQLVNDIPATSRKYEFTRSLADKMIHDNLQHGSRALRDVNRVALETGFTRTIHLLSNSLEGLHRQQQVQAWSWPWKLIKSLPPVAAIHSLPILGSLGGLRSRLGSIHQQLVVSSPAALGAESLDDGGGSAAEKLAQELLWMSQRLKENDALELAIIHWASASSLAYHSMCANPRVQKLLVKLSALLCTGLVSAEVEPPAEVTLKLLLLWIPLFCRSTHGIVDGTVFSSVEKHEAERVLERTVGLLPSSEQELVLGLWLHEFVHSSSDWPNLQASYDGWCYAARKLNYVPGEDEDESVELLEEKPGEPRIQESQQQQLLHIKAENVSKVD